MVAASANLSTRLQACEWKSRMPSCSRLAEGKPVLDIPFIEQHTHGFHGRAQHTLPTLQEHLLRAEAMERSRPVRTSAGHFQIKADRRTLGDLGALARDRLVIAARNGSLLTDFLGKGVFIRPRPGTDMNGRSGPGSRRTIQRAAGVDQPLSGRDRSELLANWP
jgi:hypothetical protein